MKKLISHVLVIIIVTLFIACSNNKDQNSHTGSWELNEWKVDKALDLNGDDKSHQDLLKEFGCLKGSTLEIKNDNTATLSLSSDVKFYIEPIENIVLEKAPIMTICGTDSEKLPTSYSYTLVEEILTLESDTETIKLILNKNTLSMKVSSSFKAYNSSTDEIIFSQDGTYLFTKK